MYRKLLSEYPESSSEFQEIKEQTSTLENNKSVDTNFYEDFDIAMSAAELTRIQSLTDFMEQHPLAVYPRCEKEFRQAEQERNRLIKAINDSIDATRQANNYSEEGISAIEKIARITRLKEALSDAAERNPIDAEKYKEEIDRLQLQAENFEKDVLFETEFNKVMESPTIGKLKKIHAFLTDSRFIPENFPHKEADYVALRDLKGELLAQFLSEREKAEMDYSDDTKLDRSARLSRARQLLREYERLLAEYPPSSKEFNDLTEAKRSLSWAIEEHRRYKELADDFSKIQQSQDQYIIINEIALFEAKATHVRSDYPKPDGVDIFSKLDKLKERTIAGIKKEFQERIQPVPKLAKNNFAGLAEYYQNCLNIANEFKGKIGDGNSLSAWITGQTTSFSQNAIKYKKFSQIATRVSNLILADDIDIKDINFAKNRLNKIKAFYQNQDWVKNLNDERELSNLENQLRNTLDKVYAYIGNYLTELSKISPDALEDEKMDNWQKQIDFIDEIYPIMIQSQDNALYSTFIQKRKSLLSKLGDAKLEELFEKDHATLEEKLLSTDDFNEKISLLDTFINKYSSYERFKEVIDDLKMKKDRFIKERDFKNFEQECNVLIGSRPQESAPTSEQTNYRNKIRAKLKGLEQFKDHTNYLTLQTNLKDQIDYVEKAIGDGSWHDIETKFHSYQDDPSETTKGNLEKAFEAFDNDKFPNYSEKVREIRKNVEKDWDARSSIGKAYSHIKNSWENLQAWPDSSNWTEFSNAYSNVLWSLNNMEKNLMKDASDLSALKKDLQCYLVYYQNLDKPHQIKVELVSVSNLDKLCPVSGKLHIKFTIFLKSKETDSPIEKEWLNMKFEKRNGEYSWDENDRNFIKSGHLKNFLTMNIDTLLNFKVYSVRDVRDWINNYNADSFEINGYEIFVPVVAEGETVTKDYTGDRGVQIKLRFSK